jgi:hypothetical protein
MATFAPTLPIDVPWKLVAADPDMMDTEFGIKKFPFSWRSSLAISAFEPDLEELPVELCNERLTFLKVTASITGYQPTKEETERAYVEFSNVPAEDLDRILSEYFACYGVLLNVAVFPHGSFKKGQERRNVDFGQLQPPTRTLPNPYQSESITFRVTDESNNRTVDKYPQHGDQKGELDLFEEMVVTFPATSRVEAKVAYQAKPENPVTMEAYRGNSVIGSQTAGRDQQKIHELAIEGEAIDRIIFRSTEGKASLLEFAFYEEVEAAPTLDDYPHIVDFEPKARDLYQASTEQGELLTASSSRINMGKSFTHTENSETGLSLSAGVDKGPVKANAGLTHSWGETDQDTSSVTTDSLRDRRERHSTTTSLSQMYNLLTGYHPGTNRATFLMLPRPHILQPTDRRTFVQGMRMIEGVQEFLLIVTRPKGMEGLSVEALLETGHMSEHPQYEQRPEEYEELQYPLRVSQRGTVCFPVVPTGQVCNETAEFNVPWTPSTGYVVDRRKGDPGHRGLTLVRDNTHPQTRDTTFHSITYEITDDNVRVHGWVKGRAAIGLPGPQQIPPEAGYLDKIFTVLLPNYKHRGTQVSCSTLRERRRPVRVGEVLTVGLD